MRRISRAGRCGVVRAVVCLLAMTVLGAPTIASAQHAAKRVDADSRRERDRSERLTARPSPVRPMHLLDGTPVTDVEATQRRFPDGSIEGTPMVGDRGVTETVAEIMERDRLTAHKRGVELEEEEHELRINPNR